MSITIRQTEAKPAAYPNAPAGLSPTAAALQADFLWQRLEVYIAHRTTERGVSWIVEGFGEWVPPLTPVTINSVEVWQGDTWVEATLSASPLGGYMLPGKGPYKFVGVAGDDSADVPAAIVEAFRRLAEYAATDTGEYRGARNYSNSVEDVGSLTVERAPAWMAQALVNCGAADLLRRYRRV